MSSNDEDIPFFVLLRPLYFFLQAMISFETVPFLLATFVLPLMMYLATFGKASGPWSVYIAAKDRTTKQTSESDKNEGETLVRRHITVGNGPLLEIPQPRVETLFDSLKAATEKFGDKPLMGQRDLIKLHKDTKTITKKIGGTNVEQTKIWSTYEMSGYNWISYNQFRDGALCIGRGLKSLGVDGKLTIFACTGRDWQMVAHGAFTQSITIVTAYDTLGEEGLAHALNEGNINAIFTNGALLPVVKNVAGKCRHLKLIIYNGDPAQEDLNAFENGEIRLISLDNLKELGEKESHIGPKPPKSDDLACIMYTSGSTGMPKGVMLPHSAIVAAMAGAKGLLKPYLSGDDVFLAFLPLAHILECT